MISLFFEATGKDAPKPEQNSTDGKSQEQQQAGKIVRSNILSWEEGNPMERDLKCNTLQALVVAPLTESIHLFTISFQLMM